MSKKVTKDEQRDLRAWATRQATLHINSSHLPNPHHEVMNLCDSWEGARQSLAVDSTKQDSLDDAAAAVLRTLAKFSAELAAAQTEVAKGVELEVDLSAQLAAKTVEVGVLQTDLTKARERIAELTNAIEQALRCSDWQGALRGAVGT